MIRRVRLIVELWPWLHWVSEVTVESRVLGGLLLLKVGDTVEPDLKKKKKDLPYLYIDRSFQTEKLLRLR